MKDSIMCPICQADCGECFNDEYVEHLEKLILAYREKRKYDGGEGRIWSAGKHLKADDLIAGLEEKLTKATK